MATAGPESAISIRTYEDADQGIVAGLITRINRELAKPDTRERFEA